MARRWDPVQQRYVEEDELDQVPDPTSTTYLDDMAGDDPLAPGSTEPQVMQSTAVAPAEQDTSEPTTNPWESESAADVGEGMEPYPGDVTYLQDPLDTEEPGWEEPLDDPVAFGDDGFNRDTYAPPGTYDNLAPDAQYQEDWRADAPRWTEDMGPGFHPGVVVEGQTKPFVDDPAFSDDGVFDAETGQYFDSVDAHQAAMGPQTSFVPVADLRDQNQMDETRGGVYDDHRAQVSSYLGQARAQGYEGPDFDLYNPPPGAGDYMDILRDGGYEGPDFDIQAGGIGDIPGVRDFDPVGDLRIRNILSQVGYDPTSGEYVTQEQAQALFELGYGGHADKVNRWLVDQPNAPGPMPNLDQPYQPEIEGTGAPGSPEYGNAPLPPGHPNHNPAAWPSEEAYQDAFYEWYGMTPEEYGPSRYAGSPERGFGPRDTGGTGVLSDSGWLYPGDPGFEETYENLHPGEPVPTGVDDEGNYTYPGGDPGDGSGYEYGQDAPGAGEGEGAPAYEPDPYEVSQYQQPDMPPPPAPPPEAPDYQSIVGERLGDTPDIPDFVRPDTPGEAPDYEGIVDEIDAYETPEGAFMGEELYGDLVNYARDWMENPNPYDSDFVSAERAARDARLDLARQEGDRGVSELAASRGWGGGGYEADYRNQLTEDLYAQDLTGEANLLGQIAQGELQGRQAAGQFGIQTGEFGRGLGADRREEARTLFESGLEMGDRYLQAAEMSEDAQRWRSEFELATEQAGFDAAFREADLQMRDSIQRASLALDAAIAGDQASLNRVQLELDQMRAMDEALLSREALSLQNEEIQLRAYEIQEELRLRGIEIGAEEAQWRAELEMRQRELDERARQFDEDLGERKEQWRDTMEIERSYFDEWNEGDGTGNPNIGEGDPSPEDDGAWWVEQPEREYDGPEVVDFGDPGMGSQPQIYYSNRFEEGWRPEGWRGPNGQIWNWSEMSDEERYQFGVNLGFGQRNTGGTVVPWVWN